MVVNALCEPTRDHCAHSGGGLWFGSYRQFEVVHRPAVADAELRGWLGANGRAYVQEHFQWPALDRPLCPVPHLGGRTGPRLASRPDALRPPRRPGAAPRSAPVERPRSKWATRRRAAAASVARRLGVAEHPVHRGGEPERLLRVEEHPGVADGLGHRGDPVGDHRDPVAHRLDHRDAEALVIGGAHVDVGGPEVGLEAGRLERAHDVDGVGQLEPGDEAREGRAVASRRAVSRPGAGGPSGRRGGGRPPASSRGRGGPCAARSCPT